jgi:hypothetical protein
MSDEGEPRPRSAENTPSGAILVGALARGLLLGIALDLLALLASRSLVLLTWNLVALQLLRGLVATPCALAESFATRFRKSLARDALASVAIGVLAVLATALAHTLHLHLLNLSAWRAIPFADMFNAAVSCFVDVLVHEPSWGLVAYGVPFLCLAGVRLRGLHLLWQTAIVTVASCGAVVLWSRWESRAFGEAARVSLGALILAGPLAPVSWLSDLMQDRAARRLKPAEAE